VGCLETGLIQKSHSRYDLHVSIFTRRVFCLPPSLSLIILHRLSPSVPHQPTFNVLVSYCPSSRTIMRIIYSIVNAIRTRSKVRFSNCVLSDRGEGEQEYQCLVCGLTQDKMPSYATCHAVAYCSRSCHQNSLEKSAQIRMPSNEESLRWIERSAQNLDLLLCIDSMPYYKHACLFRLLHS